MEIKPVSPECKIAVIGRNCEVKQVFRTIFVKNQVERIE